ncbi:MAG: hypothetical protein ACK4ND_16015 [Cytophagaceae bacterium]
MKILILSLTLFMNYILLSGFKGDPVKTDGTRIEWKENYKLRWEDFAGDCGGDGKHSAMTCSDINVKSYKKGDRIFYNVSSSFMKEVSWTKSKSEALLAHEQLHFDITELYGRKMRKALSEPQRNLTKQEFKAIIDPVFDEWGKMEKLYDKETRHGLNKVKQKEWEQMVERKLHELDAYKKSFHTPKTMSSEKNQSSCEASHKCELH